MINGYNQDDLKAWLAMIVRGATLRQPHDIQIRQHKSWLFIRATLVPINLPTEQDGVLDFVELMVANCKDFRYLPTSEIRYADFQGEWPPYKLMRELDRPKLVGLDGGRLDS